MSVHLVARMSTEPSSRTSARGRVVTPHPRLCWVRDVPGASWTSRPERRGEGAGASIFLALRTGAAATRRPHRLGNVARVSPEVWRGPRAQQALVNPAP
jgi:hypothetical protein